MTGTPEMRLKYWDWIERNRPVSHLQPKEWFKMLQDVDFSDTTAVSFLSNVMMLETTINVILAIDKEYVFAIRIDPVVLDIVNLLPQDVKIHPAFISLSVSKGKWTKSSLPAFVLPIGPLFHKRRTSFSAYDMKLLCQPCNDPLSAQSRDNLLKIQHDYDFQETNYFLVIDAISPEHPVWLIYDRNCLNMIGDVMPVNPRTQKVVFPEIKMNFDAAMILPSAKEWAMSYCEDLKFERLIETINKTKINGTVTASTAASSDVENEFDKIKAKENCGNNLSDFLSLLSISQLFARVFLIPSTNYLKINLITTLRPSLLCAHPVIPTKTDL
jgi:hypothetical protein